MKYSERIALKNGKELLLRNAEASDGKAVLENFNQTHAETDWLLSTLTKTLSMQIRRVVFLNARLQAKTK